MTYKQSEPPDAPELLESAEEAMEDSEDLEIMDVVDAEDWIHRRPTPRKRAIQVGLTLLCVLLVFGLFHSITPGSPSQPATSAAQSPIAVTVSIVSNLSFGSVTVDGKRLLGKRPYSFQVAPNGDTVRYLAPPFAPQTCRVFWYDSATPPQLGAGGNNCELSYTSQTVGNQLTSSYVLNFAFRLEDLPEALQTRAVSFLRQVITPVSLSSTVPSGQFYATGRDSRDLILSQVSTSPLTARVSLLLPSPRALTSFNSWCPELICAALDVPSPVAVLSGTSSRLWAVEIPLALDWQFLTRQGQVVGTEYQSQLGPDTVLILALDGQQEWRLAQYSSPVNFLDQQLHLIPNSLCTTGMNELSWALQTLQPGDLNMTATNDHGVDGCEIRLTQNDGTVTGTVVWRLGVLLAADAKTHSNYGWLPLAPRAELDEVR